MKINAHGLLNMKLLLLVAFLAFLLLLILRSNLLSVPQNQSPLIKEVEVEQAPATAKTAECANQSALSCIKIPSPLVQALIHYATSEITPQQTIQEISVASRVLEAKSPCNFLVFGLGHDSPLWSALNYGGHTVFLEENQDWIEKVTSKFPELKAYHVIYDTKVREAKELMRVGQLNKCRLVAEGGSSKSNDCRLLLKGLPKKVAEVEWDLIMVDAPTGYFADAPGRMGAIYTAGMMARNRRHGDTDVFVHDVDRRVEDDFSKEFLCKGYMTEQQGRLRHFTIPSHRATEGRPFCP